MYLKQIKMTLLSCLILELMGAILPMSFTVSSITKPKTDANKEVSAAMGPLKFHIEELTFRTFEYKKTDSQTLRLDVFLPEKKIHDNVLHPVIILFHGGGWVGGARSQMYFQARYFAEHGLVAVTADYRFMNKVQGSKEICIMDAKSAIRWIKKHAVDLKIDTSKVIIGGGSAGGHLATMAVLNHPINDPQDDTSIPVSANALVLFNPAYSLLTDQSFEPFNYIRPHLPAMISFFGSKDKWKDAADTLNRMWKDNGNHAETWIAANEKHAFFNKSPWNMVTASNALHFLIEMGLAPDNKIKTTNISGATLILEF